VPNKVIPLDKPLQGHGELIKQVVLREPTFAEYMRIGDPVTLAYAPRSAVPFMLENQEAIAEYAQLLIVEPADTLLLDQGGLALGKKIKKAILDFFQDGAAGGADSKTSQTTSSLESGKIAPGSGA
jgi:hypothetical protein